MSELSFLLIDHATERSADRAPWLPVGRDPGRGVIGTTDRRMACASGSLKLDVNDEGPRGDAGMAA